MKRFYEFITKANQVLLFLVLITALVLAIIPAFQKVRLLEQPHVAVAAADASPAQTEVRDVQFLGKDENLFVLGIVKRAVDGSAPQQMQQSRTMALYRSSDEDDYRAQIVNVVYSNGAQVVKTLLPADGLVLRHDVSRRPDEGKFPAHLYTCITGDSNGDKILDAKDRQDLVIVDPTLKRPDITIRDCNDFDLLPPTFVIAKVRTEKNLRFIQVNVANGEQTEIAWK